MTEKEKVKETLKEMYPQYSGFIEHTLVAEMCLKYHEKQCHIADIVGRSEQLKCPECENPYPHISKQGTLSCEDCGYNRAN